jgi:GntR family transcriptional repressor for pyruvate dehydrogenase complex
MKTSKPASASAKKSAKKSDEKWYELGRIKVPKSSDFLAEQLKQGILGKAYPAGSMLPTERELVDETGLSRGSVREALRILETQGLVHTRAGRYGGSTVSMPSNEHLTDYIDMYARGRSIPLKFLAETRLALEPTVAALAAERRTEEDLKTLRAISDRIDATAQNADDLDKFLVENVKWHDALSAASHSELLGALAISVGGLMFKASQLREFAPIDVRKRVCFAHRKILEAIEEGLPDVARRRAEHDIHAYAAILDASTNSSISLDDEGI